MAATELGDWFSRSVVFSTRPRFAPNRVSDAPTGRRIAAQNAPNASRSTARKLAACENPHSDSCGDVVPGSA